VRYKAPGIAVGGRDQAGGSSHVVSDIVGVRYSGYPLENDAEEIVSRVVIAPAAAGLEVEWLIPDQG
jgi:hypothetical protein